ncbi:MAG: hypothetical protein DELT_00159 [Desulfovibrio sp.]
MNDNREFYLGNAVVTQGEKGFSFSEDLRSKTRHAAAYDLDLLYVECRLCGNPVLWDKGKTSRLIQASGIDVSLLDSECLILADGCPQCKPESAMYRLQVVRLAAFSAQDLLLLTAHKGNA